MIQEPKNYHLIEDYSKLLKLFEAGKIFCIFDTETTGRGAEYERIVEIGAVKLDKNGKISSFGTLLNPQKTISNFITSINHIDNDMVKDAPVASEAIPKFLEFSKDCILVAHNAPFDLQFVNWELIRLNLPTLKNLAVDTLRLTRKAYPNLGRYNQPFLAETFKIDIKNAHRAEDDARVCSEIFLKTMSDVKNGIVKFKKNKN